MEHAQRQALPGQTEAPLERGGEFALDSPQSAAFAQLRSVIDASPITLRHQAIAQKIESGGQARADKPNDTGLPAQLKSGIERLSGMSMDHVRVNYNSSKPAQLQAHAYAQGSAIHVGPGQEQHLPHEAWHVVQQAQGRVQATRQMKEGVAVNDDSGLEHEADVMGAKAMGLGNDIAQRASQGLGGNKAALQASSLATGQAVQLVARTQTVDLKSQGDPPFMGLAGGGGGAAPLDNSVGVAKALGTDGWGAGVAQAPTAEYWRAHALAEVLGGAGDNANVGWWTKADEEAWSEFEEHVQGRKGAGFDKEYQPGSTEEGTYSVDSNSFQIDVKPNYVAGVTATVNQINNATLNFVGTAAQANVQNQAGANWAAALATARNAMHGVANGRINPWLDTVFTTTAGGVWAWTSLDGSYAAKGAVGKKKGQKRTKSIAHTQTPTPMLAANFGVQAGTEPQMWAGMAAATDGVYSKGNNPFNQLTSTFRVFDMGMVEVGKFKFTIGTYQQINVDFAE